MICEKLLQSEARCGILITKYRILFLGDSMKRNAAYLGIFLAILLCMTACGKQQMKVTAVNRTGVSIYDIRISPAVDEELGPNRIEGYSPLSDGWSIEIDLGNYTEKDLENGFYIQIFGMDGEPVTPDHVPFYPTFFENGSYLIFAPSDLNVFMFIDSDYDPGKYDEEIANHRTELQEGTNG